MYFKNTKQQIIRELENYMGRVDQCFQMFQRAVQTYVETGNARGSEFTELVHGTHFNETTADDIRYRFEMEIYQEKKLLPGSRGDLFAVIESFDRLPNKAETVLYIIHCQNMNLPEEIRRELLELTLINIKAFEVTRDTFVKFFDAPELTGDALKTIKEHEGHSDRLERSMIIKLFDRTDMDMGTKLLIKELIINIGAISDCCEDCGNIIRVTAAKKMI